MSRKETYSLVLLAGGKSTRMGENKAKLTYEGKTFTKVLITKAEKLGIHKVLVSGFQEDQENVQIVWDIYPERGPLGGIHACMKQTNTPFCLVLPVDVPQIPQKILEELLCFHENYKCENDGKKLPVLIRHGERRENLIGIYPVQMVDYIEDLIKEHPTSVHGMLDSWGNVCFDVDVPEWQVENINTREAYEYLLEVSKEGK